MPPPCRSHKPLLLGLLVFLVLLHLGGCSGNDGGFDLKKVIGARPESDALVVDYVGLLADVAESTRAHLEAIRDRYGIEIVVAALPSVGPDRTVAEAAVDIFSNWRIGGDHHSRGLLILFVDDVKTVKLEVGYDLEDVFTDLFTGYIEDVQLQPHYAAGTLATGLIAVMEELEARAQIKFKEAYTRADIGRLDSTYLSQGGGALETLKDPAAQVIFSRTAGNGGYPAGQSPEAAWQTMIRHWQHRERNPDLGIFTHMARLSYRDYTAMPDARYDEQYRTYHDKKYEILRDGDYAVIYFGKKKGWDNAPFLFCRTADGWQFDLVHQRRFIRMGPAPGWGVEFSEHPYMAMLMDSFIFRGQDIPFPSEDRYTIDRDADWAGRILVAEAAYKERPNDFETVMRLGRLYTLTSLSRKAFPILNKAKALNPASPLPHKYLAIAHVNATYQYKSALAAILAYTDRVPGDIFGHQFKGYILYRLKDYAAAIEAFETALAIDPDDCYSHFYLAYAYAWLRSQTDKSDPRRATYKERFHHHADRTRACGATHPNHVKLLERWLDK